MPARRRSLPDAAAHPAQRDGGRWGDGTDAVHLHRGGRTAARDLHLRCILSKPTIVLVNGDLVLVGHSYGGLVMSNAANGSDRVKALVFVGGFALDAGEAVAAVTGRYEGGTLGDTLVGFPLPDGNTDLYIAQEKY